MVQYLHLISLFQSIFESSLTIKETAMSRLFKLFAKKDSFQLKKSESGEWMVKKNYSVLYIGTKEKCQMYLSNLNAA